MLQSKEFNPENFNTSAINLKRHALKQELHGGNQGEISPQGNMQKLFDCIRRLLKRFYPAWHFIGRKCDFVICMGGLTLEPPPATTITF